MTRDDNTPLTFTVQEVAHALGVSDDTILRQIHDGSLSAIRVGRRMLPLRQPLAENIARTLAANDPRRQEQERTDALIAADRQASLDEAAEWKRNDTPENRRKRFEADRAAQRQRRVAAGIEPPEDNAGTRATRERIQRFAGNGASVRQESFSDSALTLDEVGAGCNRPGVPIS
jgi:excisionase family DNA binding protein